MKNEFKIIQTDNDKRWFVIVSSKFSLGEEYDVIGFGETKEEALSHALSRAISSSSNLQNTVEDMIRTLSWNNDGIENWKEDYFLSGIRSDEWDTVFFDEKTKKYTLVFS